MFESLTAGAERALGRADAVARGRGADRVEPLDLLAALSLEAESRAAELMSEFGISTGWLRDALGSSAWADEAEEAGDPEAIATLREPRADQRVNNGRVRP